jgi:hypothetical protein
VVVGNAKQVGVFALRKDRDGGQTNMHKAKKLNHCLKDRRDFAMIRKGPLQSKLEVPFIYPVHVACVCPPCPRMRMVPCTALASPSAPETHNFLRIYTASGFYQSLAVAPGLVERLWDFWLV